MTLIETLREIDRLTDEMPPYVNTDRMKELIAQAKGMAHDLIAESDAAKAKPAPEAKTKPKAATKKAPKKVTKKR